jgi:signal transduction histidine kinase
MVNRAPGVLAIAAGVLGAGLHAVNAAAGRTLEPSFWLLTVAGAVGYGVLALLVRDRATAALRATVSAIGVLFGLSLVAAEWSLLAPGGPAVDWAVWLGSWAWAPGYVAIVGLLPSLLPDGLAPPRPWTWTPWAGLVAALATAAWWALLPYEDQDFATPLAGYTNPVGTDLLASAAAEIAVTGLMLAAVVGGVAALAARWRRSTGIARQQLKWVLVGVVATVLLLALARVVPVPVSEVVAAVGMLPLPAAVAVAVLRHGLWDVDVVVSRGLTYLAVALVAAMGYASGAGATALVPAGGTTLQLVLVALLAPLLVPVHGFVQRRTNRWVHGFADEPWTELVRLGESLAAAADPDELVAEVLPGVVVRIRRALRASGVRLRLEDGSELVDGTLTATGEQAQVPLEYAGERLGTLEVQRAGGFGSAERGLLDRLAAQAAVAVHTVLLARETRRAREAVVLAREEERRRLRSDLHDGVGPSVAALALQVETARDLAAEDPEATRALLARLTPRINAVVSDVRALVHELRPPTLDELGLAAAVRELAARLSAGSVAIVVEADDLGQLPAGVDVAAYRIAGEAVANAVRHAEASRVTVRLARTRGSVEVEVRDDGRGLDGTVQGSGVGLTSMRERCEELGGAFTLASGPSGTTVTARLPLPLPLPVTETETEQDAS